MVLTILVKSSPKPNFMLSAAYDVVDSSSCQPPIERQLYNINCLWFLVKNVEVKTQWITLLIC